MERKKVRVSLDPLIHDGEGMSPDELIAAIQQAVLQATTDQPHHSAENPRWRYDKLLVCLEVDADHQYEECSGSLCLVGIRDETDAELNRRELLHQGDIAGARRRLAELERLAS